MDCIEATVIVIVVLRIVMNSITNSKAHLLIISNKDCYSSSFIRNITTTVANHFQLLHCFG